MYLCVIKGEARTLCRMLEGMVNYLFSASVWRSILVSDASDVSTEGVVALLAY